MSKIMKPSEEKRFFAYGQCEGAPLEVEIVDLGPAGNKAIARIYADPTPLTEMNKFFKPTKEVKPA